MSTTPEQLELTAALLREGAKCEGYYIVGGWQELSGVRSDEPDSLCKALLHALNMGVALRRKPVPVLLDLAPEDVPPDSLIRCLLKGVIFSQVQTVTVKRVYCKGLLCLTYQQLREHGAEIKRPGEDWKPCSKPAP